MVKVHILSGPVSFMTVDEIGRNAVFALSFNAL